jgi:hypothetical protein
MIADASSAARASGAAMFHRLGRLVCVPFIREACSAVVVMTSPILFRAGGEITFAGKDDASAGSR